MKWFQRVRDGTVRNEQVEDDAEFLRAATDLHVRDLCLWSCINMIANLVSKCEFKTFLQGKEAKDREYYLWNVEPNRNQNSSAFIHKWISQLYLNNECLIVEVDGQLLVADSFQKQTFALYDYKFSSVRVDDFTFTKPFFMGEVLYFKLCEKNMKQVVAGLYESYSNLLKYAAIQYQRSKGSRGTLTIDSAPRNDKEYQENLNDLLQNKFKAFFTANNAVLPLFKGYSYDDLGSKTYSSETTRDIRAMIDDISDFTARGFGIPPAIMRGDVAGTKDAVDNLLTVTIDPLIDMLQEEINRKRCGFEGFKAKTYIQIDTKTIKHVDLLSVAASIDKLVASGVFCINDIRKATGEAIIDEPWAWEHFMTKNYAKASELTSPLGGEANDTT